MNESSENVPRKNKDKGDTGEHQVTSGKAGVGSEPLLAPDQSERFSERWETIQASFVDRPRESVEQADGLVSDLTERLTETLSKERERLEKQWAQGDDVSTEDLRVALKRYRAFFDRLLST